MTGTVSRRMAALVASAALLCAGCSVSSQLTAVSVTDRDGHVVTDEWNHTAGCGPRPGGGELCDARTTRRRVETVVEP
jgi:hypothetical protein